MKATSADVDGRVLDIVGELVGELAGPSARRPASDDSLDRDLGISSLERVELLLRLERAFGVRLPDAVMAQAATPKDLATALLQAAPAVAESAPATPRAMATGTPSVPGSVHSLVDAVRWHADRSPERVHLYLRHEDGAEAPITYGELFRASKALGAGLQGCGIAKGDRVAIMLRTERAFFESFLGTLLIGAVPVPLYPPLRTEDLVSYTQRQQAILRSAEARMLITFDLAERLAVLMRGHVPSLETVATPEGLMRSGSPPVLDRPRPDEPALVQYTSGTTGDPKGVLLSHGNILANVRAIGDALEIGPNDVGVSWLPLYHDMGLIGLWLGALYFGAPVAIMSPLAFLSRPARWLRTIHAHRGTISAAPNFAFDLCARKLADEDLQGLDLSSWRVAINGAEAVSADTLDRFTRRFAPYGFKAEMCPAFGLAESSVALTIHRPGRPLRIDRLARAPFESARDIRSAGPDDPRALRFVSCGPPLRGHEVRIVDVEVRPLGERRHGRIQCRGPSVTRGYFGNDAATAAAMHDGWMDTGDLGYLADGDLFVTGREKDLIIQAGRNICAEEVEALTSTVPGVRPSCVAAFGVRDTGTGTERLVVVAEAREQDPARRDAIQRAVRARIVEGIGTPPDVIVIAEPRTVRKTSSGKIRRTAMREAYLTKTLGPPRSALWQRIRLLTSAGAGWAVRFSDWLARVLFSGWVLIVLLVSVPGLWAYLAVRGSGRSATRAAALWTRVALRLSGLYPRVAGVEHLRNVSAGIMVANHASYLDPLVLMAAIPVEFHFAAKRGLTRYPLLGTVLRRGEHATIERVGMSNRLEGARQMAQRLQQGQRLVVFPEGTFTSARGLLPFHLGAFRASVDTGCPIVPVAIAGTRHVLSDRTWLMRRGPITVTIGALLQPRTEGWPEMVRLRNAAVDFIARECGEPAGVPR